jgi:hypothetical protein
MQNSMKKWLTLFTLLVLMVACKSKKKPLTQEENIKADDFIEYFDEVKLPLYLADSSFQKRYSDSAIGYKIFTRFVPDSLLTRQFGKNLKPLIYPMTRVSVKKQETYLFVKAVATTHKTIFVLVFDKDQNYIAGMPLLVTESNNNATHTAVMDSKYSITINTQRKTTDGRLFYKKASYAFIGSAGEFALIVTESNEAAGKENLINPIDTLARKNRLSGDYVQDKKNIVSVRDGKKVNELLLFIHFEKNDGQCKGELKGVAKIISPGRVIYSQSGDQCILQLSFSGNKVTIKEEEGCGSHRDIKCFFEGNFIRKVLPRPAKGSKNK